MSQSTTPAAKRTWWNKPSTYVSGLFLIIAAIIAGFAVQEFVAKQQIATRLDELRRRGMPIDDASMDALFTSVTNSDQTVAWNEVGYLASGWVSTIGHDLPGFGENSTPATAYVGGIWPAGQRVGELLEQIQPLIQQIHEAADKTQGPVWQPIHFDGFSTLLGPIQEARSISRLLQLDYEYAVYTKDRNRALRDLKSSLAAIKAYQWDSFLVAELVNIAQIGMVYNSVGQSLKSPMWTAEDLNELKEMFDKPLDLKSRWAKITSSELATAISWLENPKDTALVFSNSSGHWSDAIFTWVAQLPSSRLQFLREHEAYDSLGNASLENILQEAAKIDQKGSRGIISSVIGPSFEAAARVYVNMEESRRMLQAAIALKQYRLAHGEFPKSLEELLNDSTVGITRGDLEGVDHSLFGYKYLNTQTVVIWNTRPINGGGSILAAFDSHLPVHDHDSGYPKDGRYGTVISFWQSNLDTNKR